MKLRGSRRKAALQGLLFAVSAGSALGAAPGIAGELPSPKEFCSYVPVSDVAALLGETSFKISQSRSGSDDGFTSTVGNNCSFFSTIAKVVSVAVSKFKSEDEAAAFMDESVSALTGARVAVIAEDSVGEEAFYMMIGASIGSHYARKGDKVFVTNVVSQAGDLQASTPQKLIAVTRAIVAHF